VTQVAVLLLVQATRNAELMDGQEAHHAVIMIFIKTGKLIRATILEDQLLRVQILTRTN
jgi:hypothetical protein